MTRTRFPQPHFFPPLLHIRIFFEHFEVMEMKVWPPHPQIAEQFNGSVVEDVQHFPSVAAGDPCLYEAFTLGKNESHQKIQLFHRPVIQLGRILSTKGRNGCFDKTHSEQANNRIILTFWQVTPACTSHMEISVFSSQSQIYPL